MVDNLSLMLMVSEKDANSKLKYWRQGANPYSLHCTLMYCGTLEDNSEIQLDEFLAMGRDFNKTIKPFRIKLTELDRFETAYMKSVIVALVESTKLWDLRGRLIEETPLRHGSEWPYNPHVSLRHQEGYGHKVMPRREWKPMRVKLDRLRLQYGHYVVDLPLGKEI